MSKTPAQRAAKHGDRAVPGKAVPPANPTVQRSPQQARSNANLIIIAGVVTVLFLFWYYHLLTLNQMTQLSGGLAMPDSLIGGYDLAYLESLRSAMDADALGQLSYLHKTAGLLFPLIFGLTWLLLIGQNTQRRTLRWVLWSAPLLFVIVDLWENVAIDAALGAAELTAGDAALAGGLTLARWILLGLSLLAAVAAVFSRRVGRPPELLAQQEG